MTMDVKITCDDCGSDLTTTSNCEAYRLAVIVQSINRNPGEGAVTAMADPPPIGRDLYFCGIGCLRTWFEHRYG